MAEVASLFVRIAANTDQLVASLETAQKQLQRFSNRVDHVVRVATVGLAGISLAEFARSTVMAASDVEEAQNKVNVVFGESAAAINQFAVNAARDIGLSRTEALKAAGDFGNMFSQLGTGSQQAAEMSEQLTRLAADFASFHNADITDVIEAQTAAFRGEFDALQRFVPTIDAAAVAQQAMALTGKTNAEALTAQDKALATYHLMLQGAGAAVGDFQRTNDGFANSLRQISAALQNTQANLGRALLPAILSVIPGIKDLIFRFEEGSRIIPETVTRLVALVRLGFTKLRFGIPLLAAQMAQAVIEKFNDMKRGAADLADSLAALVQRAADLPLIGGFATSAADALNGLAGSLRASAEASQGLTDTIAQLREAQLSELQRIVEETNQQLGALAEASAARPVAPVAIPTAQMGPGSTQAAAQAAQTALQELGISTQTLREAMRLLGMEADEQRRILIALGEDARRAGPIIEGLGVTHEELAEAFNRAGLDGEALAARIPDLIAAERAAEEEARKLKQAQEEALREAERITRERTERMADLLMQFPNEPQKALNEFAKATWMKDLETQIAQRAELIQDALRQGLDPSQIVADSLELFDAYQQALGQVEARAQEAARTLQAQFDQERLDRAREVAAGAVETFKRQLELGLIGGPRFNQEAWERATFGRTFSEMRRDAANAAREMVVAAQRAAEREMDQARRREFEAFKAAQFRIQQLQGRILGITVTPERRLPPEELEEVFMEMETGRRRRPGGLSTSELRQLFRVMAQEIMAQFQPTVEMDGERVGRIISSRTQLRGALLGDLGGGF